MNVSSLFDVNFDSLFQAPKIHSDLAMEPDSLLINAEEDGSAFGNILDAVSSILTFEINF